MKTTLNEEDLENEHSHKNEMGLNFKNNVDLKIKMTKK